MSKQIFLTGLAAGAALMGAGYLGRRNLTRTQRLTGIIPIVTPYIDIETAEGVLAVMERLPEERVTIVLHTLGGCVTACVLIANALRQFRDSTAIVPYMAISGGTLIALSARRLEMGDRASLSAVDPQIMGQRVKHLAEAKDKPSIAALAREYDVAMRLPFADRNNLDALGRIYLPTQEGAGVPLSLVTRPQLEAGPNRIDRVGRERAVTVTAQVATGLVTAKVTEDIFARLAAALKLPPGYRIVAGGEAEAQKRSFGGLWAALLLALFGIMAALILEFRSFKASAVVAGVIPLGIMGGIVALWVTGYTLSFTAVIGFIALVGIEIKNSILLVDFTVQLQRQGAPLRDAIEKAGEIRFLPVLLTSATAIGGLLPLAVEGSGLYSPLACVIIGGLLTSTLLSRIVTPVMYLLLAPRGRRPSASLLPAKLAQGEGI